MTCTLFPATKFDIDQLHPGSSVDLAIRGVSAEELINVQQYVEGQLVILDDWVGLIEEVHDEVAVQLSNNSVVVVEYVDELEPEDPTVDRLSVGDRVKTKKGNLRRGLWKYGAFDPHVQPHGMVVEARTVRLDVRWLAKKITMTNEPYQGTEPPSSLEIDEFESPRFHVYDASPASARTLPLLENGTDRSYHVADVSVGDRVRFKDLAGAAVKYDGTNTLPGGRSRGRLTRIPRTETLGYDMNVYVVMQTHSQVTVQWQDLSITEDPSPSLIPDPRATEDDEVWPAEIVCTREKKNGSEGWCFEPARVGVVQAVRSRDRIASVRWFDSCDVRLLGEDPIDYSTLGQLSGDTEDVSLYDIRTMPGSGLTRRRGDFVLLHPLAQETIDEFRIEEGPDWFGEVTDLGLDGKITVRLGAAKPVVDVQIPVDRAILVYNNDMSGGSALMDSFDRDSDDISYDDESEFDSESMWIEYEGMDGEPLGSTDDEDWSTEEEDADDSDVSMPDLVHTDDVDTSKTTPEAHSHGDQKSSIDSPLANGGSSAPQANGGLAAMADDPPISIPEEAAAATITAVDSPLEPFLILDNSPEGHYFSSPVDPPWTSSSLPKRIAKDYKILRSSLPPGILVRTWESRLDLLRVLIIGPSDTPYEYAPFIIDMQLPPSYPQQAPQAFFHSWTNGAGPVNPNLYEDGKICLSLLGTWHADERNESWSPTKSTLLQVLVSIMGLVLVKEPYYNEAGYDVHREAPETKLNSALYTERAYFLARGFIVHALSHEIHHFDNELKYLYLSRKDGAPRLLEKAIASAKEILERSLDGEGSEGGCGERDGLRRVSLGAAVMLRRQVEKLEKLLELVD